MLCFSCSSLARLLYGCALRPLQVRCPATVGCPEDSRRLRRVRVCGRRHSRRLHRRCRPWPYDRPRRVHHRRHRTTRLAPGSSTLACTVKDTWPLWLDSAGLLEIRIRFTCAMAEGRHSSATYKREPPPTSKDYTLLLLKNVRQCDVAAPSPQGFPNP